MAYSCKKSTVTRETLPLPPPDSLWVIGRKHRCRDPWCPSCGVQTVRRALWRVRDWDWRKVRTVMVSIDRGLFSGGPLEALGALEKERSAFVRELNRRGAGVERFVWFCEWHDDGFPHYHFLLLMREAGRAGQIGGDLLRASWRWGRYVHEGWIKSQAHWDAWVGYAAKTGYMHRDGKRQAVLPSWALDLTRRVRRTGSSCGEPSADDAGEVPDDLETWAKGFGIGLSPSPPPSSAPAKAPRTNRDILSSCGRATDILVLLNARGEARDYGTLDVPYWEFAGLDGVYVERYGWAVLLTKEYFLKYYSSHHITPPSEGDARPEPPARASGTCR